MSRTIDLPVTVTLYQNIRTTYSQLADTVEKAIKYDFPGDYIRNGFWVRI